jgi:hypothetical protein
VVVSPSTRDHVRDHLGQAEFALKVAANFECLKGTPAHAAVCAALAQVAEAKAWVQHRLGEKPPGAGTEFIQLTAAERHRLVQNRMSRLAP